MQEHGYGRQEQIRLQSQRLTDDALFRLMGGTLAYIIAGVFLPIWIVGLGFFGFCCAEFLFNVTLRRINAQFSISTYVWLMILSTVGVANYAIVPVLLWLGPHPLEKFVAVVAIIGAMLATSIVRSIYLPMGLWNLAPAAAVFLWMPLQTNPTGVWTTADVVATTAAFGFTGYLLSLTLLFNRTHTEMVLACKRSDEAAKSRSRLFSAMSHELRTPLHAILGLNMLQKNADHYLQDQALRLLAILDDTLDIAPPDGDNLVVFPTTTAVAQTLGMAVQNGPALGLGPASDPVLYVAADVPAYVSVDADHLRRALRNLCIWVQGSSGPNVQPGRLVLHCAFARHPAQTLRMTITLPDWTGPNLSPADIAIDKSTLSFQIAERATNALCGTITILRQSDGCIGVTLEVPCKALQSRQPLAAADANARLSALVIDDIGTNRLILMQMLKSLGIRATEAASGEEAIEHLRGRDFDVVLLDLNMPGMDGSATFQAIRALTSAAKDVPVIALTADTLPEQRHRCFELGVNDYLTKPVDAPLLWAAISRAVSVS